MGSPKNLYQLLIRMDYLSRFEDSLDYAMDQSKPAPGPRSSLGYRLNHRWRHNTMARYAESLNCLEMLFSEIHNKDELFTYCDSVCRRHVIREINRYGKVR